MLFFLVAGLALAAFWRGLTVAHLDEKRMLQAALDSVAARYGLEVDADSGNLSGTLDEMRLTIEHRIEQDSPANWCLCVAIAPRMSAELQLESRVGISHQLTRAPSLQIGDPEFDEKIVLRGPARAARAVFGQQARAAALTALGDGVFVADGLVQCQLSTSNAETIVAGVEKVHALARLLDTPDEDDALAKIARCDLPAIAAEALAAMRPGAGRDVLSRALLLSRNDAVTIVAASHLGGEAMPTVLRVFDDPDMAGEVRSEALRWLAQYCDATQLARAHLHLAELMEAALDVLEKYEAVVPLPALQACLRGTPSVAVKAAQAMRLHRVTAEPALIDALKAQDSTIVVAVAQALGAVATITAIKPMRARLKGVLYDAVERTAIEGAISAIQSRVALTGGEVSVAEVSQMGGLSDTGLDAAGRLSDPQKKE